MTKSAEAKRDELLRTKDRNTNPDVFSPWSFDAGYAALRAEAEKLYEALEKMGPSHTAICTTTACYPQCLVKLKIKTLTAYRAKFPKGEKNV